MNQNSIDIFLHYDLPFETYFHKGVEHVTQIHDETELIWVIRGTANIVCESVTYNMTPQTLFMINPFQTHTISSSEESLIITFRFKKEYLLSINESYTRMYFVNRIYTLEELVKKYKEIPLIISQMTTLMISKNPSSLVRYKIVGYYNMLIYELYTMLLKEKYLDIKKKAVTIYLDRLTKITDYISKNFISNITLEDLSNVIGISRFRLSHFIKENIGVSFRDYLFNMRVEYALRLLRESDLSVAYISKHAGFSDVKYLNKQIKNRFNTTALKYRKKIKSIISSYKDEHDAMHEFFYELEECLKQIEYMYD